MANNPKLLQDLLTIMQQEHPPAFFLNKDFDVYKFAQNLFQEIENKRSSVTALTRSQAQQLGKNNLQFSNVKHESRINTFYRLIGLPTELNLENTFSLLDANGAKVTKREDLIKNLLQREFEQLQLTFKQFLQANSVQELNAQLDSLQAQDKQLIGELFDPQKINTNRMFPMVQFSQIQNVVETKNRISPSFASTEERYVNEFLTSPPFLETVITIRLLPQSGGTQIKTQGAVEDIILQSLGYALGELVKQYHRNQVEAENHLKDGIALIRNKVAGANSPALKKPDLNANARENDGIKTEIDIRSNYIQEQLKLYDAVISLLPTENDIIPIGTNIDNTPFQSRNIKENALTQSFLSIINANLDAIQRSIKDTKKVMQKRQLIQDKLTAELHSAIGQLGGISMADIIIVIAGLFVLDEEDLVGLIPESRFKELIGATNNNTTASSSTISDTGAANTAQKQINIFDILKQFDGKRTKTVTAVQILQDVVKEIYKAFVKQLGEAHKLNNL